MRIQSQPTIVPVSSDSKSGQPAAQQNDAPAASTESPAAVVSLSSAGTSATSGMRDLPDPKVQARIAQIRQQLQNGSYPIDLDELASRIADDELVRGVG
jgi:flagellar biosynthesis anti-sigma factor FlgM